MIVEVGVRDYMTMGLPCREPSGGNGKPVIGITCGHTFEGSGRFYVNEPYVRCIEAVGGLPFLIPCLNADEDVRRLMEHVDGILLPGGVDVDPVHFGEEPIPALGDVDPTWDHLELCAARLALRWDLPILGICRGIQMLNIAAGGTLYQDIPSQFKGEILQHTQEAPRWYPTHGVHIEPDTLLEQLLGSGEMRVNSFHHQAVKVLAPGFSATARSHDGIIEAMESQSHAFACGVQWHPEHMVAHYPKQLELFRRFIGAAAQRREGEV